jgi:hypothetical protein
VALRLWQIGSAVINCAKLQDCAFAQLLTEPNRRLCESG